jgi:hypothetical protein
VFALPSPDIAAAGLPADWTPPADVPTPPPSTVDDLVATIRRHIYVTGRIAALTAELKTLEGEKDDLSRLALDLMLESGMDSPPGVDGRTAYLSPVYRIKIKLDPETGEPYDSAARTEALRAAGLDALIQSSYNGNTVKATLREMEENGMPIPEPLSAVFEVEKVSELRTRAAAAKKVKAAPRAG